MFTDVVVDLVEKGVINGSRKERNRGKIVAAFMMGTAPTDTCDHPADHRNILQKIFGLGKSGGN